MFGFPCRSAPSASAPSTSTATGPEPLSDDQHADALMMADVAARAVLAMQADAPAGRAGRRAGGRFATSISSCTRPPGMVAAQLDVSVGDALVRLRAYAFANDRPLADIARDVVARRLRFD